MSWNEACKAARRRSRYCFGDYTHVLWKIAMVGCVTASASASAQTPYDGTWNVTTQTRTGSCEPLAHYALTLVDGRVSGPENVSGTVSRSGNVRVSIGAAYANGQLGGSAGSGKWNAASGGAPCSGRWEASKQ
jgi:hypothetical protein